MDEEYEAYPFREFYVPARMMKGLILYARDHIRPGDFLCAIISNNLSEAVGRADEENLHNLPAFIGWLYNEAPSRCWGSPERMEAWLAERRVLDGN